MLNIILIKSNGDIIEKKVKSFNEKEIYKYCNYRTNQDFQFLHTFTMKNEETYTIYGKTNGRANTENKYDLPPPIDTKLLFGTLCIFKKTNDEVTNLMKKDWLETYESLFGGFEDLNENETRSEDSEIYSDDDYTKEGYLKDNFVVDDDELEEEEYV